MVLLIGSVLAVAATLQALEFIVAYHMKTTGHWRDSAMGWHVMSFMAAIASVLLLASIRFIVVELLDRSLPLWFEWLRLATFASVPVVLAWRRLLLARVHSQSPPQEKS